MSEYAQFLGGSASLATSLDLDLDPMQATAFFALFDIERTRVLNALLGHSDDSVGASTKAVAAAVVNPLDGGLVCLLTERTALIDQHRSSTGVAGSRGVSRVREQHLLCW